jgi:hypothetical protein
MERITNEMSVLKVGNVVCLCLLAPVCLCLFVCVRERECVCECEREHTLVTGLDVRFSVCVPHVKKSETEL